MTRHLPDQRSWRPTFQPRRAQSTADARVIITCRMCLQREEVALDNPVLLCSSCRADPAGAFDRLTSRTAAAEAALNAVSARFRAALAAAAPRDQERYRVAVQTVAAALSDPQGQPSLERVLRSLARAGAAGDGLAALLTLEAQVRAAVWQFQAAVAQEQIASEECRLARERQPATAAHAQTRPARREP